MKKIGLLLVLALLSQSVICQHSDLKEYGFKGNIKTIDEAVYLDLYKRGGEMPISKKDKPAFHRIRHFTRSGQIDTLKALYYKFGDSTMNNVMVFDFKKGIKTGGKYYIFPNEVIGRFKIEWINDRSYKMITTDLKGKKTSEVTCWLDSEFRDSVGQTLDYVKGKVTMDEKYTNHFDSSNRLVGVDYFDEVAKSGYSLIFEYLEFDQEGNWTKSIVRDKNTGEFRKMSTRTITYY
jgi:hypothetical protein